MEHDLSAGPRVLDRVTDTARLALSRYDIAPDAQLDLINVSENATFCVTDTTSGDRTILRVHRQGYHSRAAISSELAWLTALRVEAGIRVPAVLSARDGGSVIEVTGPDGASRYCVRFEFMPGAQPTATDRVERFLELGALTARMHQHARGWTRPAWFKRFAWDHEAAFGANPRWGRWQNAPGVGSAENRVLSTLDRTLAARLTAFGTGANRYGLIHADLRLTNLLVGPGERAALIDFDDCGWGWWLYDLAAALSFIEDDPQTPELIDAWLRGYRAEAGLPIEVETEIPTMIMFRRLLLLAWLGSHPIVAEAQSLGSDFARVTCDLAERYLSG